MRILLYTLLLCLPGLWAHAQTYRYIGVEDGLSSRRVYAVEKDSKGYMWFLTQDGIDRYNGSEIKTYRLTEDEKKLKILMRQSRIETDSHGTLWGIGHQGTLFCYDSGLDRFTAKYHIAPKQGEESNGLVSYGFIDRSDRVWLCSADTLHLYSIETGEATLIPNLLHQEIIQMVQTGEKSFFAATDSGLHLLQWNGNRLEAFPLKGVEQGALQVIELYYHPHTNQLFIGTFQRGLYVYQPESGQIQLLDDSLIDISINHICEQDEHHLLIATDGAGVYRMHAESHQCSPYIKADYTSLNAMNGNNILDIYVDEEQRIWLANYPIGVTVRDDRMENPLWLKHAIGNRESIVNDQVNDIIEDQEGDFWFATNNGISLYRRKEGRWQSFLSEGDHRPHVVNHTFLSLCEVSPGTIWVGGYSSGLYEIHKNTGESHYFTPSMFTSLDIRPDKYIRAMCCCKDGTVWSGGYYNLKAVNLQQRTIQLYPQLNGVTAILEKDDNVLWIGTSNGLFLLEKKSGKTRRIPLPADAYHIYSLCQTPDGILYVGTSRAGLVVYHPTTQKVEQYLKDNCALISNNIYSILYDRKDRILLATENAVSYYNPETGQFNNWTREQGLCTDHFNASSGLLSRDGKFVLGSTDGAVIFDRDYRLPGQYQSKMVFSDLRIFYQTVHPEEPGSPLKRDIDLTRTLRLKYNQNIFSMKVSSINYDYPSLILYSWRLEGFYNEWSRPERENTIRFTNLNPGTYTLQVRAISSEDRRIVLEERSMKIIIDQPFWLSTWAILLYIILFVMLVLLSMRYYYLRKQRKISKEKIRFFVNTAHDIRNPLTLIKVPLEELEANEELSESGKKGMATALRNVNALLHLTTNLINFERADLYSDRLLVARVGLRDYLNEVMEVFRPFAEARQIALTLSCNAKAEVWMDRNKMDSILKNLISNALKYTPQGGNVDVTAHVQEKEWDISINDTGIGIPPNEQKKIFKTHYRASNAINLKVTGSGIGLLLVKKLVKLHKGTIHFKSSANQGTCMRLDFPNDTHTYRKYILSANAPTDVQAPPYTPPMGSAESKMPATDTVQSQKPLIMIVEDNDELRTYLKDALQNDYEVRAFADGDEAMVAIQKQMPQLLISDIMMPKLRGDELCKQLKENLITSHLPVILLTALGSHQDIVSGLGTGADEYIPKPFSIHVLKATIANLLANRERLRKRYTDPNFDPQPNSPSEGLGELDHRFILNIRKLVEEHMADADFSVDRLCQLMYMSRTSLYNKIKALTGESPADYARIIRLQYAARLLKEKRYNVTEIAELTGFNDAKHFREVFKKYYHTSPTHYAQNENQTTDSNTTIESTHHAEEP